MNKGQLICGKVLTEPSQQRMVFFVYVCVFNRTLRILTLKWQDIVCELSGGGPVTLPSKHCIGPLRTGPDPVERLLVLSANHFLIFLPGVHQELYKHDLKFHIQVHGTVPNCQTGKLRLGEFKEFASSCSSLVSRHRFKSSYLSPKACKVLPYPLK